MMKLALLLPFLLLPPQDTSKQDQEIIDWAKKEYGIEVITKGMTFPRRYRTYTIQGEEAPAEPVSSYLKLLKKELGK